MLYFYYSASLRPRGLKMVSVERSLILYLYKWPHTVTYARLHFAFHFSIYKYRFDLITSLIYFDCVLICFNDGSSRVHVHKLLVSVKALRRFTAILRAVQRHPQCRQRNLLIFLHRIFRPPNTMSSPQGQTGKSKLVQRRPCKKLTSCAQWT